MNKHHENVLKGQHNIAQGNALGIKGVVRIVRAMTLFRAQSFFRTKKLAHCLLRKRKIKFRPKEFYHLDFLSVADGVYIRHLPRALPWAEIFWPFRPEENKIDTLYKVLKT